MNRDQIERSLRQPGPRERGYLPVGLPATLADADGRRPQRALLFAARVATFAAAVAGGAILAVVLTRGGGTPGPGNGSSASPSSSEGPSPSPTATGACRSSDFAWTSDRWDAAAGSTGTTVIMRGVASLSRCRIDGAATLEIRDGNGAVLVRGGTQAMHLQVGAGTILEGIVLWSNWCGPDQSTYRPAPPPAPLTLELTLPGDRQVVPLVPSEGVVVPPGCSGLEAPTTLSSTDFKPSARAPQG
jgi:hypothetical protein